MSHGAATTKALLAELTQPISEIEALARPTCQATSSLPAYLPGNQLSSDSDLRHTSERQSSSETACDAAASTPATFEEAYGVFVERSLAPWARWPHAGVRELDEDFDAAPPWCRVQLCVIRGELHVRAFRYENRSGRLHLTKERIDGGRQTAFVLGYAALLRQHRLLPDGCVLLSCSDRPIFSRRVRQRSGRPRMVLSYMTSADHHDLTWPDYLFWGRPGSHSASWPSVYNATLTDADALPFSQRLDRTLYASKLVTEDTTFFRNYMPLRREYAMRCLFNCSS